MSNDNISLGDMVKVITPFSSFAGECAIVVEDKAGPYRFGLDFGIVLAGVPCPVPFMEEEIRYVPG